MKMARLSSDIAKLEQYSFSGEEITRATGARVIVYDELKAVRDIRELFGEGPAIAILYQSSQNYGHWVALIRRGEREYEFFDPYGIKIDDELTRATFIKTPLLSNLLSGYKVNSNRVRLQANRNHINTCGRWVAYRILQKHMNNREFANYFDMGTPDVMISLLTMHM